MSRIIALKSWVASNFSKLLKLWGDTSTELKSEVLIAFFVVIVPGIYTITPPSEATKTGILNDLYQARWFLLGAWVAAAVGGALSTIILARSRDKSTMSIVGKAKLEIIGHGKPDDLAVVKQGGSKVTIAGEADLEVTGHGGVQDNRLAD